MHQHFQAQLIRKRHDNSRLRTSDRSGRSGKVQYQRAKHQQMQDKQLGESWRADKKGQQAEGNLC